MRRELEATQEQAEAVIALSQEEGFALYKVYGTAWRSWAVAKQGRQEEGVTQIRQAVSDALATGLELSLTSFLGLLAEVYWDAGQPEEGLTALTEAFELASKNQEHLCEAELYRLKGELLLMQDELSAGQAESCFQRAIEVARQQCAKSWELRATMSLARLLVSRGRRAEARAILVDIYSWFTEGFDTADLKDAKAMLEELAT
jgi:predicted ATPase